MAHKLVTLRKKIGPKFDDPFWYDGAIAKCGKLYVAAVGDIRVVCGKHKQLCWDGVERNCCCFVPKNDKDIQFGSDENQPFWFSNNNWFEVLGINQDDDPNAEVCYSYDEAIEFLKELANE